MKVALYTRVSTEDQVREGFSLEVQQEYLTDYANRFKYEIVCNIPGKTVYMDDGYSGGNTDRPALQKMLFDARNRQFDTIVVYKQDRFSRNLKELLTILDELEKIGVGFISATEPLDTTTSAGKLSLQMLGSFAEFERNRLKECVFPGMIAGVKKGHWQGAKYAPYGYVYNKKIKKLEVNPDEAKIVKEIYAMYISGKSSTQIAAHYYHLGVPSRSGGKFYSKFIGDILKNKVYLGMLVRNKKHYDTTQKTCDGKGKGYRYVKNDPSKIIEVPNTHEPIISQYEFDAVQKRLDKNRNKAPIRFKNNIYYLSGVLFCNECGGTYRGKMVVTNHRTKAKKPWYFCSSYATYYIECKNKAIPAHEIEEYVWSVIDVITANTHILEELTDMIKMAQHEPDEFYSEQLKEKEDALSKNLGQQKSLYEIFSEDRLSIEIYREKADKLRNEEKNLRGEIRHVQLQILDRKNNINVMKEVQDFLVRLNHTDDADLVQQAVAIKQFMRIIFKGIYLQDRKVVRMELNQPWKYCYEEGLKIKSRTENENDNKEGKVCQEKKKTSTKARQKRIRNSPSFCKPTVVK